MAGGAISCGYPVVLGALLTLGQFANKIRCGGVASEAACPPSRHKHSKSCNTSLSYSLRPHYFPFIFLNLFKKYAKNSHGYNQQISQKEFNFIIIIIGQIRGRETK
jgi:hypothetical protein